ncbi:DUF1642 domain-containing protein [Lacticaseibacillus paracasei]|uniref:DUF1642 domain-containing protein n=1 Tax=Lacticaseibacillus paracasei TaxID=1597 RepID=UPI00019CA0CF|nr:DUF1642 domain-containing protein [Lacticaseibacillus paracasei]EEI68326.1 hypothetical protein HMPREF0530_1438 [Lacticaseibacillus paracasei subsp. paracasei ATCC 25302 = DSM 5622 = JCM 8130]KRM65955.1 hypothetical protein FC74_GL000708 [Lacticaseibacillus paracasei subsp. paracasei ATCC 25302 = DSM 5622 = JCM 8130]MBA4473875.1 DUF1642 domain-containing protein [Lacticaseibacillus paracasei]TDG84480.1 hypothetical protein C5L26_002926 [Lacticaseibacillus paracasei subsp. paracasei]BAN72195
MNEEKLYMVKNDEGKYLDCEYAKFLPLSESYCPTMVSEDNAKAIVNDYGGHIVTLIEEPKKVVLNEEQAEIVEGARDKTYPATYISDNSDSEASGEEKLLMNAYVNGYTVAKEKKYRVLAPKSWWYDIDAPLYLLFSFTEGMRFTVKKDSPSTVFTKEQLSAFGLDGEYFVKEEVTDDAD